MTDTTKKIIKFNGFYKQAITDEFHASNFSEVMKVESRFENNFFYLN